MSKGARASLVRDMHPSTARGGLNESNAPIPRCGVTIFDDRLHFACNDSGAKRLANGSSISDRFDATFSLAFSLV